MTTVLHIIQALSLGGAARALVATSKSSARQGSYRHRVISLLRPAPDAVQLAEDAGLTVIAAPNEDLLRTEISAADIVQLHWWNNPQNQALVRQEWPACRLLVWYHIAGDNPPQLITPDVVEFADLNVPTNPWSYRELSVFKNLPAAEAAERVAMVLDAADLDRVSGAEFRPHPHFNVGYIGAVDFVKMHRRFVPMSAAVRIPDVRFVVCGQGIENELRREAASLGAADRFDFRGYVSNIRPIIETFDVYGYPLCADSYASGELNLQEVMAVGVPPVVFPAGGIKGLVEHEKTGLIVHSELEYRDALEYLFHHPEERRRLGQGARAHAQSQFGADHAARELNPLYERLLRHPKRKRSWGVPAIRPLLAQPISLLDVLETPAAFHGVRLFVESLGEAATDFVTSLTSSDPAALLAAEDRIAQCSLLMRSTGAGGFRQYLRNFPSDPFLQLWHALALHQETNFAEAAAAFGKVIEHGCDHWRVGWYIARAADRAGDRALAQEAARAVLALAPEFEPAKNLLSNSEHPPGRDTVRQSGPAQRGKRSTRSIAPALFNNGAHDSAASNAPERSNGRPSTPSPTFAALDATSAKARHPTNNEISEERSKAFSPAINEAFLASQREFWNVESLDEAMFGRVFTSAEITRLSFEERKAAWDQSAIASVNQILNGLPARPDWCVLEIGCGVGRVLKPMRARFAQADGVDISEKMIEYARAYLRDVPGRGEVHVNNGADLAGLPDARYDLVYSIIVFQHIRSVSVVRNYLRETRRVLKPGGYFRLQVYEASGRQGRFDEEAKAGVQYGFNGNGYTVDQLRQLLSETGFDVSATEIAGRWIWATARRATAEQPHADLRMKTESATDTVESTPLISAIVSTYNSERFIRGCLEDLERQTIADRMEIIVIDSGSTQNERAVVDEFQRRYSNIRYIRTAREPLYTAWNRGVRLARGRYVTNANTDDRHEPNALERHIEALEKNPQAVLAYADVAFCENVHPDFGQPEFRGAYRWPDFDGPLLFANCYIGPQPVWRRAVHDRYGLFDESYKSAGDYEFWLRLAVQETFVHIPEVLGTYWYSAQSVGHDNIDLTKAEADRARKTHWRGPWASWPKLKRSLLQPLNPPPAPSSLQSKTGRTSAAIKSPFVIDFGAVTLACGASIQHQPQAPFFCGGSTKTTIGQVHRERILSFIPGNGRVLVWGAKDSAAWIAKGLPAGARLTCIEPSTADGGHHGSDATPTLNVGSAHGPYDVVLIDGDARNHCLWRSVELLGEKGVIFLHDAQWPEFDAAKRAAVEFGHLGPCPDAPKAHLWWGGVALRPVPPPPLHTGGAQPKKAPVIVNFYTANTPYEEEAKRLVASARAVGVDICAEPVSTRGQWVLNCAFKARFILQMWEKLRRPILWLDADAVLHARPELLIDATCDFAIHKIDGWQFASGTIFFNQTPAAERLLRRWVERCESDPTTWDQVSLDLAWEDIAAAFPLETLWLPDVYTKIFDRPSRFPAHEMVVEHFQASRRLKRAVSAESADERPRYPADLLPARRASRPRRDQLSRADLAPESPDLFTGADLTIQSESKTKAQPEEYLASALVTLASRSRQRGQLTKAAALLWNATACQPASAEAWRDLIDLYHFTGGRDATIHVLRQAERCLAVEVEAFSTKCILPPTTEAILSGVRGQRIAIVGNATPAHEFGSIIDDYDVVIRLNNFRTTGFETKVGSKTTFRCTSGWHDIERRDNACPEFSPFAAHRPESANVAAYNELTGRTLSIPETDIKDLLPAVHKPSTGCALVALCSKLGLTVDLFAFDGFKTSHYWAPNQPVRTTHHGHELEHMLRLPGVTLHSQPPMKIPSSASPPSPPSGDDVSYCLPPGYQARLQPQYYEDSVTHTTGIVWQPDVYPIVADLARQSGCCHVLDLGCGSGDKLAELHPEFMITGVDYGKNIRACRERFAFGQWLEANFENARELPVSPAILNRTIVVCSDVLEHLVDPVPLLQLLARLLEQVPIVVLSTPARDRARGPDDMGPPKNKAHVREWALPELARFLRQQKLPVEFVGFTRSNTQTGAFNTLLAILTPPARRPEKGSIVNARDGDAIGMAGGRASVVNSAQTLTPQATPVALGVRSLPRIEASVTSHGVCTTTGETDESILAAAEAQAREALRLNPQGLEAWRLLVSIGLRREQWNETGRSCLEILKQAPNDRETLLVLAKCFFKGGDRETTRTVLERILEIDPSCTLARENLDALNDGTRQSSSSISTEAAPGAPPKSAQPLQQALHQASEAIGRRDLFTARQALEQVIALAPPDADLFVTLGHVQSEMGDLTAARTSYARALAIDSRHAIASERIVELTIGSTTETASTAASAPAPATAPSSPPAETATFANGLARGTKKSPESSTTAKESAEMAYWQKRKEEEGTLANGHYEAFFTTHFHIPGSFYAGRRILDIGCGPRGSLEWANQALDRVGLDPLAERYRELGTDAHRMRYVASGSETIPFPDDYFDVVTSFNSLDHVESLDRTIQEILRVVKPGGLFLLLTDVNHAATPCEPIEFGWEIVDRFKSRFDVVEERHYEKAPKAGLYRSIDEGRPYDHSNPTRRYGVLSVKFCKRPALIPAALPVSTRPTDAISASPTETVTPEQAINDPVARNARAFSHLQCAFDLLKQRKFTEAQTECGRYRAQIDYAILPRDDRRVTTGAAPELSIVIVAYRIGRGLIECLDSLAATTNGSPTPHEIIVIDNGGNDDIAADLARRNLLHVRMPMNVILSEGRNVGVHFARAPIVAFIDDDAVAEERYVDDVLEAFATYDIDAYRGRVLPKSDHANNRLARHYDMGGRAFPADVDTEGNSAFRVAIYRELGGMDPLLFGMEGTELSYRIECARGPYRTIYWPRAVIRHDYAGTDDKLGQKNERHQLMRDYAVFKHPKILRHHQNLIAFNQTDSSRATGHELLRPAPKAGNDAPLTKPARVRPFITVCVPTYNRAGYIEQTLESIFQSSYSEFEVVVVDDGSTDQTAAIVEGFKRVNLRYVRKEHSGGPATRNRCIAEARGEFLVWVDSDDIILPKTLDLYAAELARHPEVDVLYGDLRIVDEKTVGDFISVYRDYLGWPAALISDLVMENRIPNVCTLVRKNCYERFGGYSEKFPRAHDYEFWSRLADGGIVRRVNAVVGLYRQHGQSLSQHRGRTDTSYEARVVCQLVERFGLSRLLPHCYRANMPSSEGDARAALLIALLLLKYDDAPSARKFIERSGGAPIGPISDKLRALLVKLYSTGQSAASSSRRAATKRNRKEGAVHPLIETAVRAFNTGNAEACAAACARLSESHPEAIETLVLVGASLYRWGNPRAAVTAFQYAFNRQSEQAGVEAIERAAESTAPSAERTSDSDALRPLNDALCPVLGVDSLPACEVRRTIDFIQQLATRTDLTTQIDRHAAGFSALSWAILRLGDGELRTRGDERLANAVRTLTNALAGSTARRSETGERSHRRSHGYSFCIITNGQRPEKVRHQIESIRALNIPEYEILVGGDVLDQIEHAITVPLTSAAREGRLGAMRNALARRARYDRLVVSDDDLRFDRGFFIGLERFGDDYDVMAVALRNPDGTRFWDWATAGGLRGQILLDYWEVDPDVYVTGGLCVLKAEILDQVSWDASLGFYKGEDVDFSRRVRGADLRLRYNPFSIVVHDDDRYTQIGRKVMRFDHLLNGAIERYAAQDVEMARHYLRTAARLAVGHADRQSQAKAIAERSGDQAWFNPLLASLLSSLLRSPQGIGAPNPSASSSPPAKVDRVSICWDGSFLDLGSLSHVNRELTSALGRRDGVEITCVVQRAEVNAIPALPELRSTAAQLKTEPPTNAQITVRHAWPPDWRRPRHGAWVLIQPWEFGSLPREWIQELARVDEIWVPSQYAKRVYVDSGVAATKVHVVPNGIDPIRFRPEAPPLELPTRKKFKFLFVGGTIHRKGPDILLKAFLDRFTAADDVCLVIKDFGGQGVYEGQTFEQTIAAARNRTDAPEILHLTNDLSADQMSSLYAACDCLVHPYRGEGFGLPVLEAMACGRPVVVTAGGATDDFVPEECGWHIPAARREFGDAVSGMTLVQPGWFLEADPLALGELMTRIVANPDQVCAKGRLAAEYARAHWTWDHAAAVVCERIEALVARRERTASARRVKGSSAARPIELPSCARLGHLAEARSLLQQKQFLPAWEATVAALGKRPFHPEAYSTLAEIAQGTGDARQARELAELARRLAPGWKPSQRSTNGKTKTASHGGAKIALPELPAALRNPYAAPRLSVCLIVKNEEQFLDRCLESVRGVANQIVVVDTGSNDATCDIARRHGAEMHSFTWNDNFSDARNVALQHATGDWILFLDADEELVAADREKLLKLIRAPKVIAYRLPIIDCGREEEGVNYVPRLYRNAPGLFYVGRVHEQVFSSIEVRRAEWGLENVLGDATLLHHGYTKEVVAGRDKIARNLRLLEQAIDELPNEPHLLSNLGLELVRAGRLHEGLERYQEAFAAMSALPKEQVSPEAREALLTQYGTHLLSAKHYAEIARLYQSPLAKAHGLTATMHWVLGLACIEAKLYSEGADQMRHCLNKRGKRVLTLVNRNILKAGPHHCLALCLAAMKRPDEAGRAFQAALHADPDSRTIRFDYARFLAGTNQEVEALKWVHQLMAEDPSDARVWRLGGATALQKPDYLEFAIDWTGEALKHHSRNGSLIEQRATALLLGGRPADALPLWQQLKTTGAASAIAALALCEIALGPTTSNVSAEARPKVQAEFLAWYRRLLRWNAASVVAALNQKLDAIRTIAPGAAETIEAALAEAAK